MSKCNCRASIPVHMLVYLLYLVVVVVTVVSTPPLQGTSSEWAGAVVYQYSQTPLLLRLLNATPNGDTLYACLASRSHY